MTQSTSSSASTPTHALTRRGALTAGALASMGGALSSPFLFAARARAEDGKGYNVPPEGDVKWSACTVNCGSKCALRMHVVDGAIRWVETDNTGKDEFGDHQARACARGRSMRHRVYNADRLKYPMKRVGKRGEGKFERISWDEALDIVTANLQRIIKQYGNESVYLNYATGTLGGTLAKSWPQNTSMITRLMNCVGGYLNHYNTYSTSQITTGLSYSFGAGVSNSPSDIANTKLVVMFGYNAAENRMSGGGVVYHIEEARARSNARVIVIDPRYNENCTGREDEWIPIRPGADVALISALAYVLITENMVDEAFLEKYCVGYDEKTLPASAPKNGHYKAYILGQGDDATPKTPQWASPITGIPVERIVKLAREIGAAKPCCILQGWGMQRHANGEMAARAVPILAQLTGNFGISGGGTGANVGSYVIPFVAFPMLTNPVKDSISVFMWTDAIERGPEMTALRDGVRGTDKLKAPIKFIWNYAGNALINQHSDINRTHEILQDDKKCEMIVVIDTHMTSSAKFADILLPGVTASEQADFVPSDSAGNMAYVIFAEQAIKPLFECRTLYDVCTQIAKRMGVEQKFTEGRSEEDWLRFLYEGVRAKDAALPTFDDFRKMGIYKRKDPNGHFIAYKAFRDDPIANKLNTPSGKIEIYSEALAKIAATWELKKDEVIHPLPIHVSTFEGWNDPNRAKYPLQLIGFHYKSRTHSTYGNVEQLDRASRQELWINPVDAAPRGVKNGDRVRIFNDRGETHIEAKVTPRIMPGVVALGEGAWYKPDGKRIDQNGSINVLTTLRPSPLSKGNPQHTNLVDVRKLALA